MHRGRGTSSNQHFSAGVGARGGPGWAGYLGYLASTSVEYLGYKPFILFITLDTSAYSDFVQFPLSKSIIRSFELTDAPAIVKHASSRAWGVFKDTFPNGLSIEAAQAILREFIGASPETWFAIEVDRGVIGALHVTILPPPEQQPPPSTGIPYWFSETYPGKATVGYWLDEAHRGRGIVDEAFPALSKYMARCHNVHRMLSFRVVAD